MVKAGNVVGQAWEREFVRYVFIGGVNTAIGQLGYWLLLPHMNHHVANVIVYVLGIMLSYVLNTLVVFRQPLKWKKFIQFPLVYAVQLGGSVIFLYFAVDEFGLPAEIGPLLWIALSVPLTFVISRFILRPKGTVVDAVAQIALEEAAAPVSTVPNVSSTRPAPNAARG